MQSDAYGPQQREAGVLNGWTDAGGDGGGEGHRSECDEQPQAISSVHESSKDGTRGSIPDITRVPLPGPTCFHTAVHTVCEAAS